MAVLVISKNDKKSHNLSLKKPGMKLVSSLRDAGIFQLLDVPNTLYLKGIKGRIYLLGLYIYSFVKLFNYRKQEYYFYNFHKAYLPLYLLCLVIKLRRPSLFLADGINCTGIKQNEVLFLSIFKRVISLPKNAAISKKSDYIWFPGCLEKDCLPINKSYKTNDKLKILFNSNLIRHNYPEEIIAFAKRNESIKILISESRQSFITYLKLLNFKNLFIPSNIQFVGVLSENDYLNLLKHIDCILILRDESNFYNKYNFPSKIIEALGHNIPIINTYPISSISKNLYFEFKKEYSEKDLRYYLKKWHEGYFEFDRKCFLKNCDPKILSDWLK